MLSTEWDHESRIIVCLQSKADFVVDFLDRSGATRVGTLFSVLFFE